jgi:hypothetical protein
MSEGMPHHRHRSLNTPSEAVLSHHRHRPGRSRTGAPGPVAAWFKKKPTAPAKDGGDEQRFSSTTASHRGRAELDSHDANIEKLALQHEYNVSQTSLLKLMLKGWCYFPHFRGAKYCRQKFCKFSLPTGRCVHSNCIASYKQLQDVLEEVLFRLRSSVRNCPEYKGIPLWVPPDPTEEPEFEPPQLLALPPQPVLEVAPQDKFRAPEEKVLPTKPLLTTFNEKEPQRQKIDFPEPEELVLFPEPNPGPKPLWKPAPEQPMPAFLPPSLAFRAPEYVPPPTQPFPELIDKQKCLLQQPPKQFSGFKCVFVLDVSGAMHGTKLEDLRAVLAILLHERGAIAQSMGAGGGFNMVAFSTGAEAWMAAPVQFSTDSVRLAHHWVRQWPALRGGAGAAEALRLAYSQPGVHAVYLLAAGGLASPALLQQVEQCVRRSKDAHAAAVAEGAAQLGSAPPTPQLHVVGFGATRENAVHLRRMVAASSSASSSSSVDGGSVGGGGRSRYARSRSLPLRKSGGCGGRGGGDAEAGASLGGGTLTLFGRDIKGLEAVQELQRSTVSAAEGRLRQGELSSAHEGTVLAHNAVLEERVDAENATRLQRWEAANAAVRDESYQAHRACVRGLRAAHGEAQEAALTVARKQYKELCTAVMQENELVWREHRDEYGEREAAYLKALEEQQSASNRNHAMIARQQRAHEDRYMELMQAGQRAYEQLVKAFRERRDSHGEEQQQKMHHYEERARAADEENAATREAARRQWESGFSRARAKAYEAHEVALQAWKEKADVIQAKNDQIMDAVRRDHHSAVAGVREDNDRALGAAREEYEEEVATVEYTNASIQPVVQRAERAASLVVRIERFLEAVFRFTDDFQGTVQIPVVVAGLKEGFPGDSARQLVNAFEEHFTAEELRTRSFYPFFHHQTSTSSKPGH